MTNTIDTTASDAPVTHAATVQEAAGLLYLDPSSVRFTRSGARIDVSIAGAPPTTNVSVLRAFPLSAPKHVLSIRTDKNTELGILADPAALDRASLTIVEEELRRRYVMPVVRRVIRIRERFEILECEVETDRGSCRFSIRNLRENLLRPHPNRYILTDVDGNRFDIPDLRDLPLASQAELLAHL